MGRKICPRTELKRAYEESPKMTVLAFLALFFALGASALLIAHYQEPTEAPKLGARQ